MIVKALIDAIKPKQTFLLMVTFLIAYFVAGGGFNFILFKSFFATFLAIAGTTALNMFFDKDVDMIMQRTRKRPVPSGRLKPNHCLVYGSTLLSIGLLISLLVDLELLIVLFLGFIFDIPIYTILLKRRSSLSILLGGIAGAMPALAGWVAVDTFSLAGILLALIVFLWIPSHIWYISIYYEEDYRKAGIPMLPLVVGMDVASWVIVTSIASMLFVIIILYYVLPLNVFALLVSILAILMFLYKAVKFALKPSRALARIMYKIASFTLGIVYFSILFGKLI
ncbi:MAG: heme o synthase [Archaeoglobaceae archaeon]|nr:heme o synthase [Archaeoglobaceae archaeon]MCX8151650.1 heme o synthase [Archaeoglobaceae archaeon]MDW8013072.1 heme o synthase [Archaeoglobaceae archaeon]